MLYNFIVFYISLSHILYPQLFVRSAICMYVRTGKHLANISYKQFNPIEHKKHKGSGEEEKRDTSTIQQIWKGLSLRCGRGNCGYFLAEHQSHTLRYGAENQEKNFFDLPYDWTKITTQEIQHSLPLLCVHFL